MSKIKEHRRALAKKLMLIKRKMLTTKKEESKREKHCVTVTNTNNSWRWSREKRER